MPVFEGYQTSKSKNVISAIGPKRTFECRQLRSAIGSKGDVMACAMESFASFQARYFKQR